MQSGLKRMWVWAGVLLAALAPAARGASAGAWKTYENCTLVTAEYYDGDSFHARHGRRQEIFRLYFVDAPETDTSLDERIDEQAEYWDLSRSRVMAIGEQAKVFAAEFLKRGFTVETRRADARGNSDQPRYFAFVRAGEDDMGLALVGAGLARLYGLTTDLPDGTPAERYRAQLRSAERRAQREKRGAWAGPRGRDKAAANEIREQDLVLAHTIPIYSLKDTGRVGVLKAGTAVHVLGAETSQRVRIRFRNGDRLFEAACKRSDLGLSP
jgi:endonuclease YncB( thermonuclease family)